MTLIKDYLSSDLHTNGKVGIEVEMEGDNLPHANFGKWRVESDSSLRGSDTAEYVLRKPVSFKVAQTALQELTEALSSSTLTPSVRAGVHIHINVQEFTLTQVANLVTLYLVLEDLLLEVCGEGRQSNLFCLKGCEAELMVRNASLFFRDGDMSYINNDDIRYSGINLAAIPKYGSVEFRSLRTPNNIMDIMPWINTLERLAKYAVGRYADPTEVIINYSGFEPEQFLRDMAPDYAEQLMQVPDWKLRIKRGMRCAQDIAFSKVWTAPVVQEVDDLPDVLKRMIEAYPHIDRDTIISMYMQRTGGGNENV